MQKVISKDGTPIVFEKTGQGPAIILVMGAAGDHSAGAALAAQLAPHLTVFNYDRRGRGESGDTPPYAVEREIEDIDALIKEAGGSAFVYGISSGAALSLAAAAHGLAITKLALYEPTYFIDNKYPRPPADQAARYKEFIAAGRRGDAVAYFFTQVVGKIMPLPPDFVAQARKEPWWPEQEALADTYVYDATIMGDHALPVERVASVKVPTLVMDGGASFPFMHDTVRAMAEILPNGQRRTLEGQNHAVDPTVLAPVLVEFFKE